MNSELSEDLGTVAGFAALALGFSAGNDEDFLGPAMVLEACELYPCQGDMVGLHSRVGKAENFWV